MALSLQFLCSALQSCGDSEHDSLHMSAYDSHTTEQRYHIANQGQKINCPYYSEGYYHNKSIEGAP